MCLAPNATALRGGLAVNPFRPPVRTRRNESGLAHATAGVVPDGEYAALLLAHQRLIHWLCRRKAEELDHDEVFQEVNLTLWNRRHKFDPTKVNPLTRLTPFGVWLRQNFWAARTAVSRRGSAAGLVDRRHRRVTRVTPAADRPDQVAERAETVEKVRAAVAGLPTSYMRAVAEARLRGVPLAAVAEDRGVSRQTVAEVNQRATVALRDALASACRGDLD